MVFVETPSSSDYLASDEKMTDELRRVKDETVVTYSMVLW